MFSLRTLSFRDVVRALKQGKPRLALGISQNLVSNAVNTVHFRLRLRPQDALRRSLRKWS